MRAILLLLTILFSQQSQAENPTSKPTTAPAIEFTSDKYRFRLFYNPSWILPDKPLPGQAFSAQTPSTPDDQRFAVISLRIDIAPASDDRQALVDLSDSLAAYIFNNGGKKVTLHNDRLGQLPARSIRFTTDQPSGTIQTMYLIAVKNRTAYVWTLAAPPDLFSRAALDLYQSLSTFEILQ